MIKKVAFGSMMLAASAFGALNEVADNQSTSTNIITSASYGKQVVTETRATGVELLKKNVPSYHNETVFNWINWAARSNPRGVEVVGKSMPMVVAVKADANPAGENAQGEAKTTVVKGFCYITRDLEIGKQPSSLRSECETNVGAITLFANLVNVNEKASLIVDPVYIERNGVRFKVESSIVTNEPKTSYNIATFVNDRKLSQVGFSALEQGANEFKTASNQYLQALEKSQTKQEVNYVSVSDSAGNVYPQAAMTTNTEKPDPLDYLVKAGVNLVSSTVQTTAQIFRRDLPYLYYVSKDTKIWVDLRVSQVGEYVK